MPAKFIKSYKYTAPDGAEFDTIEEEIVHELKACGLTDETAKAVCGERHKLIAILNQRERKHASPVKVRKPRTPKPESSGSSTPRAHGIQMGDS